MSYSIQYYVTSNGVNVVANWLRSLRESRGKSQDYDADFAL
jgi:hypothetical protein